LAVVDAFADAHVDHDLVDRRHLQPVLVAEILRQLFAHHLLEMGLQARRDALLRRARLRRLRRGLALAGLLALVGPVGLLGFLPRLGLLRLVGALGPLVGLLGLAGFLALAGFARGLGLGFAVSHRSRLPNAWRPAPCVDCRPRRRT